MDPPVSVPMEKPTRPAAVAEPGPADDPLEPCRDSTDCSCGRRPTDRRTPSLRRELRHQHGARIAQANDHFGVVIDDAILEVVRAPRRRIALRIEEILHAIRNAVQQPAIAPGRDRAIRRTRLGQRALFHERRHAIELGVG
jgi:hypothetical protein